MFDVSDMHRVSYVMKTLSIDMRLAGPTDAAAIADVHRNAWQHAYSGIIPHRR